MLGWGARLPNVAGGSLRSAMVAAVIGIAIVLPWIVTVLSLVGGPLALHVIVPLATACLTTYALRRLGVTSPATDPLSVRPPRAKAGTSP